MSLILADNRRSVVLKLKMPVRRGTRLQVEVNEYESYEAALMCYLMIVLHFKLKIGMKNSS
jgi:positive regulator of sigma E activity